MQESEAGVTLARRGAVAILTLNDPKALNALSAAVKAGMEKHVPVLLDDPEVRAIVITGAGNAFCAGGDIRSMDDRAAISVHQRMRRSYRWLMPLLNAQKPVVTAVNGAAAGAGFALALTGDYVCVSAKASFRGGFFRLGAVPDFGLAYTLPRAVGMLRAKDILLSNRDVDAEEALRIGLASRVFEPDELLPKSLELAAKLAEGPTIAFGLAKTMMQRAYQLPIESFLDSESAAQVAAFGSEDFGEGVAAFRAKRKPAFKGK